MFTSMPYGIATKVGNSIVESILYVEKKLWQMGIFTNFSFFRYFTLQHLSFTTSCRYAMNISEERETSCQKFVGSQSSQAGRTGHAV